MSDEVLKPTEAMIEELRRHAILKPQTEYGRGWNCGLEEAEAIVSRTPRPVSEEMVERLAEVASNSVPSNLGRPIGWAKLHEEEREVYRVATRAILKAFSVLTRQAHD